MYKVIGGAIMLIFLYFVKFAISSDAILICMFIGILTMCAGFDDLLRHSKKNNTK